jgi:hypothetical protein
MEVIDDVAFADLAAHFEPTQIAEIWLTVGMSNAISSFHATEVYSRTREVLGRCARSANPNVPED